jgi:hypothetical protein
MKDLESVDHTAQQACFSPFFIGEILDNSYQSIIPSSVKSWAILPIGRLRGR